MSEVIKFKNVGKMYKKGRKLLLKEALVDMFLPGKTEIFWALKDINFEVKKGESIGIIGPNGSGKSTILKLIAGVTVPTKGKVKVSGKIAPLIELGAGFHPELSGRENIYINGAILGISRNEMEKKFKEIVEFSELGEFIDTPIKHYSSGMYMRLGFSVAISVNPDIFLVDEILAVGDSAFQEKCLKKMESFKKKGVTMIMVSHSMEQIKRNAKRGIVLVGGKIIFDGEIHKAIDQYNDHIKGFK
jgi:ABC-type polysaccharide/polyol phosphate transport system ATPase subunit